jgi:hypothetical protein
MENVGFIVLVVSSSLAVSELPDMVDATALIVCVDAVDSLFCIAAVDDAVKSISAARPPGRKGIAIIRCIRKIECLCCDDSDGKQLSIGQLAASDAFVTASKYGAILKGV